MTTKKDERTFDEKLEAYREKNPEYKLEDAERYKNDDDE